MIYLGLEICHYRQLVTINPPMVRTLEEKIDAVVRQSNSSLVKKKAGLFLFAMGEPAETDPKDVLDAAFHLQAALVEFREELYGYNLLLASQTDPRAVNIETRVAAAFLELLEDEALWIHNRDADFFLNHAHCEAGEDYTKIVEIKKAEPTYNVISYIPQIRSRIIQRLAQLLLKWLGKAKNYPALVLVTGRSGSAREEIAAAALASITGKGRSDLVQTIGGPDAGLSPLSVLVESIRATGDQVLKRVPQYLLPHEKRIWKTYDSFLLELLAGAPVSGDRSEEDFFFVYHLYLTAYFRLMEERLLPGIIFFRFPERLAASLAGRFKTLFDDLGRRFRIAVVLVSARRQVLPAFHDFKKLRVTVKPFGRLDARRCFAALYPGVKVPRKALENILRLSRGRYGALLHYIYYLRLNRKIMPDGKKFAWVPKSGLKIKIPVRQRTATATIIRSLKEEARTILYVGYCLGGFFTRREFLDFYASIGLVPRKVEEQLAYLRSMELFFGAGRARFAAVLRQVLYRLSAQKTKYLDEQMRAWVTARLADFVPGRAARCFRFLASVAAADLVVDHLAPVINYCLDARLLDQAEYFLTPAHFLREEDLSAERRKRLAYTLFAYRLRFHLLSGHIEAADKLVARNELPLESLVPQAWFARAYLELGRYHLCREETSKALPLLKRSLQYFQELDMTGPSSESFLELGCGFLAKGNLKEALEYFGFAKKLIQDIQAPFIHVRALWAESAALYLRGNYSRIVSNCDAATLLSASHGFREAELLFSLLKARVLFDLGFYDRASLLLREGLALARLYGLAPAAPICLAWLARCAAYLGEFDYALALLRTLTETDETLFIRGEVYFLAGEDKKAEKVFTKALNRRAPISLLFPEFNSWLSGFSLVEGRCLALNEHGTPLFRLCRAFRAVLQCRSGNLDEGVAELHLLTTTEKFSEADPHVYLFYYLYYTVLKTLEKSKTALKEVGHGITILNKALKNLQERSTFMDEPRDRINYVTQNYWNKFILDEAKANKLV
jgi:tetratricopeptide (TPR) repeat protein